LLVNVLFSEGVLLNTTLWCKKVEHKEEKRRREERLMSGISGMLMDPSGARIERRKRIESDRKIRLRLPNSEE